MEELNRMSQKIPSQDSNSNWDEEKLLDAYRKAAEYDDFLFGDFDYSYVWLKKDEEKEGQ